MKFLDENLIDHLQRPEFAALRESLSTKQVAQNGFICQPDSTDNDIFIVASLIPLITLVLIIFVAGVFGSF